MQNLRYMFSELTSIADMQAWGDRVAWEKLVTAWAEWVAWAASVNLVLSDQRKVIPPRSTFSIAL